MHGPLIYSYGGLRLQYTKQGFGQTPISKWRLHEFYERTISFTIPGCSLVEKSVLLLIEFRLFKEHLWIVTMELQCYVLVT